MRLQFTHHTQYHLEKVVMHMQVYIVSICNLGVCVSHIVGGKSN